MINKLKYRVSPKKFDENIKVPHSELYDLIEACNMAPTSFGIQPVRISIVTSEEMKKELLEGSYYQPQITSCSNIIVFNVFDVRKDSYIDFYAELMKSKTNESEESIERFKSSINKFMYYMTDDLYYQWASKQAYLTLGILVAACAEKGIDICPIEGFQHDQYSEILDLKEDGYSPVIIAAIGKASANDPRSMVPKVRIPNSEYVINEH